MAHRLFLCPAVNLHHITDIPLFLFNLSPVTCGELTLKHDAMQKITMFLMMVISFAALLLIAPLVETGQMNDEPIEILFDAEYETINDVMVDEAEAAYNFTSFYADHTEASPAEHFEQPEIETIKEHGHRHDLLKVQIPDPPMIAKHYRHPLTE